MVAIFMTISCSILNTRNVNVEISEAEVIEFGIFDLVKVNRFVQGINPDGTEFYSKLPQFIQGTDNIPNKEGIPFGLTYLVRGAPIGSEIKTIIKIKSIKEKTVVISTEAKPKLGRWTNQVWTMDNKESFLPGNYIMQVFNKNRCILEKKFSIISEN